MARFTKLDPSAVHVGRGRAAFEARQQFVEAIRSSDTGRIDLERGDRPGAVKRLLQEAPTEAGTKVRSSWEDSTQKTLLWKKTKRSAGKSEQAR
jgi:hypothetical protein